MPVGLTVLLDFLLWLILVYVISFKNFRKGKECPDITPIIVFYFTGSMCYYINASRTKNELVFLAVSYAIIYTVLWIITLVLNKKLENRT